jgi:hypothetical protein
VGGGGKRPAAAEEDATRKTQKRAGTLEYAFGETGTEHVLVVPSLGEGATEGGTVAFRFASGSGCAVVEHPSRRRRRSARLKTGS